MFVTADFGGGFTIVNGLEDCFPPRPRKKPLGEGAGLDRPLWKGEARPDEFLGDGFDVFFLEDPPMLTELLGLAREEFDRTLRKDGEVADDLCE